MHKATGFIVALVGVMLVSSVAFGWGNATHTYFAKRLGVQGGPMDCNEIYGSVLPDAFNLMFDANRDYLYDQTHHNFMAFAGKAWNAELKAVGFGFTSHNDTWGADFTAHHAARTNLPGGYAVSMGIALAPTLVPELVKILKEGGLGEADAQAAAALLAPEIGHDLVETGVDLQIKATLDGQVGWDLLRAAKQRPDAVPLLLAAAYAPGLASFSGMSPMEAAATIIGAEVAYQKQISGYGRMFTLATDLTIKALAEVNATVAEAFIEAYVPIDATVTAAQAEMFIRQGMAIVQGSYAEEVAKTLVYLQWGMGALPRIAAHQGASPIMPATTTPGEFSLGQNYPNPFNPTTTITYALPVECDVTITLFNAIGQEVMTLVNEKKNAGVHTVTMNAADLPSGLYLYRIVAGTFTETKKLTLLR